MIPILRKHVLTEPDRARTPNNICIVGDEHENNCCINTLSTYGQLMSDIELPLSVANAVTAQCDIDTNLPIYNESGEIIGYEPVAPFAGYGSGYTYWLEKDEYGAYVFKSECDTRKILRYPTLLEWYQFLSEYYNNLKYTCDGVIVTRAFESYVDLIQDPAYNGFLNIDLATAQKMDDLATARGGKTFFNWASENCFPTYTPPSGTTLPTLMTYDMVMDEIKWFTEHQQYFNEWNEISYSGKSSIDTCQKIESIITPDLVMSIEDYMFYKCAKLTGITIPTGVTQIGNSAFYGCTELTNIIIPDKVNSIGDKAFYGCVGLTDITIPEKVINIGKLTFNNCSGIINIMVEPNNRIYDSRNNCNAIIKTSTNELIVGCKNSIIPEDITRIGSSAFEKCVGITNITIPSGITSIGTQAFISCVNLTGITILSTTPATLGSQAFDDTNNCLIYVPNGCGDIYKNKWSVYKERIVEMTPQPINSQIWYKSTNGAPIANFTAATNFGDGIHLISDTQSGDYRIVEYSGDVTKIEEHALSGCTTLLSITLPDTLKSIGYEAFRNCYYVKEINMPDSLSEIGISAFFSCLRLSIVTWPNQVVTIADGVFQSTEHLTKLIIPETVTQIGRVVFNNCMIQVTQGVIICKNPVPPVLNSPLPSNSIIYVPAESIEAYKEAYNWSSRKNYMFPIENEN